MKAEEKRKIHLQESHIKVYRTIEKYIKKNVIAPEILEIVKVTDLTKRHVIRVLDDLQELGYITRVKYAKRSIQILKEL